MKLEVLLTGSSGFLGQHLLKTFADVRLPSGYESCRITALYRSMEGFQQAVGRLSCQDSIEIDCESLDFTQEKDIDDWISKKTGFDVCIHAAALASPRTCQEHPTRASATNVPKHFLNALLSKNPKLRIIALSTDHVYAGDAPPYLETDGTKPVNGYGRSKVEMEEWLLTTCPSTTVVLRSSIILGARAPLLPDKAHGTFVHFVATCEGEDTTFFTDEKRSVVAVDDVIGTILWFTFASVEAFEYGVYNMGGPQSLSRFDIAKVVFEHLGFDPRHLLAAKKATQPPNSVPSPLDISMDSSRLQKITNRSFQTLQLSLPSMKLK